MQVSNRTLLKRTRLSWSL